MNLNPVIEWRDAAALACDVVTLPLRGFAASYCESYTYGLPAPVAAIRAGLQAVFYNAIGICAMALPGTPTLTLGVVSALGAGGLTILRHRDGGKKLFPRFMARQHNFG